jgi:hypothetical protein
MKMNKNIQKNHTGLISQFKAWNSIILINKLLKINNKMKKRYKKNQRRIKKLNKNQETKKVKIYKKA